MIFALCVSLSVAAIAADFEHCAEEMNEIGVFNGTQKGFELDRAPTRAEAATMLVRLLGAEKEALALSYTAPYTDVADWAKPYVQYLHNCGLTKGTSAATFGYSDKCTAVQYATFLLRALGYSDSAGGDFTYAKALDFAREKKVVDDINCDEDNFLRDHVAAMSYTALATAPKSGEADLLTKLVKSGKIADAKGLCERFENYREYVQSREEFDHASKVSMDMTVESKISVGGEVYADIKQSIKTAAELRGDESKMSYCGKVTRKIEKIAEMFDVNYYYASGYMYLDVAGEKVKTAMPFESAKEEMGAETMQGDADPISAFEKITKAKASDGTVTYTAEYAYTPLNNAIGAADTEYKTMSATASVKNGVLVEFGFSMDLAQIQDGEAVDMKMTAMASNIKYGDGVEVTLPEDLDSYIEQ